jgi:hypothetical protein
MSKLTKTLSATDRALLKLAHEHLEHPSLAARLTNVVGTPIEIGLKLLPKGWYDRLHNTLETAIEKALDTAISSLRQEDQLPASPRFHGLLGITTGAVGGFFGLPGLLLELPITTTIMMRAIADIARSEGEDLGEIESRLACMEVFALGGRSEADDAADTGYYGLRLALALPVTTAARHVATHGLSLDGAPALVGLIVTVASRFGASLSHKAAALAVPVIGAAGGAAINAVFMQHFEDMARHHFAIRRLERKYGPELIQSEYRNINARASRTRHRRRTEPAEGTLH